MSETKMRPDSDRPDSDRPDSDHSEPDIPQAELTPTPVSNSLTVTEPATRPAPSELGYDNSKPKMSEALKYLLSFVIVVCGCGIAVGLSMLKTEPADQEPTALIPMVSTVDAASYSGELDMIVSGTVVSYREVTVAAEVAGNVIKKYPEFEAGNFVKKGDKLLEIDPKSLELQLKTNEAEVTQAQKMLEETEEEIVGAKRNLQLAKGDYDIQSREYNRNARLQGVLSASEIDQAKATLLNAQTQLQARKNTLDGLNARLERMKASLDLSKSTLDLTRLNLSKTTVYAPDDGVIVRETVQEGNYVNPGMALLTIEDTRRSEVICNLTTDDLDWIRNNSPASAEFEEASDDRDTYSVYYLPKTKVSIFESDNQVVKWDGILERFDGIGRDSDTKTIPCRITVEKPIVKTERGRRALVRGMYVKCKIQVQTSAGASETKFISFPAVALRPGNYVWVVKDRKLDRREVEVVDRTEALIGEKSEQIVVVRQTEAGVQPGEMVVTSPLSLPTEGAEVVLEGEKVSAMDKDDSETDGPDADGSDADGESKDGNDDEIEEILAN